MLCKCHWIVLYTVHFTAFCLGGRFSRTRCMYWLNAVDIAWDSTFDNSPSPPHLGWAVGHPSECIVIGHHVKFNSSVGETVC